MDSALRKLFLWRLDYELDPHGYMLIQPGPEGWAWERMRWRMISPPLWSNVRYRALPLKQYLDQYAAPEAREAASGS